MSDTIVQECKRCGLEIDCIDGICLICSMEEQGIDPDYEKAIIDEQITFNANPDNQ